LKLSLASILKYVLFLGLAALLLYWAFKGQDLHKLAKSVKQANPIWIAASVIACLLAHVFRALRWNMLIKPLGYTPSAKNSFYAVMIGYLANLAVPRMGEVSRCGVLKKSDGIPVTPLIGTVFTERLSDLAMLLSITALTLILEFERIATFMYQYGWLRIKPLLSGGLLLALGLFLMVLYFLKPLLKKWMSPLANTLQSFKIGVLSFKQMPNKLAYLGYSVGVWACYFLSTYLAFFALASTTHLSPIAALAALVFGSLGMIVPVQGGIGAFHWMVAEGLTLYALPKAEGLGFATLIHSSQILVILIIGGLSLLLIATKRTVKTEQ
jgi:uncharacterized protein (TIRG00374 family)